MTTSTQSQPLAKPIVLDLSAPIFEQNDARRKIAKMLLFPDQPKPQIIVIGLTTEQKKLLSLADWSRQSSEDLKEYIRTLPDLAFGGIVSV